MSRNPTIRTLIILLMSAAGFFSARADESIPSSRPDLNLSRARGEISIDGRLDDQGWAGAVKVDRFFEHAPGDRTEPAVRTVAYMTYDDQNLYVAGVCYDDPADIRATFCDRDQLVGNDVMMVVLDPWGEARRAYFLYVNPFGVQSDAMWAPLGGDFNYNIIFESAGQITDSGYQVEVAIPFSSLHYPAGETQTWKFDINRVRPRESWFEYSLVTYDRNNPCRPCQWGSINIPEKLGRTQGLVVLPSAVGFQTGQRLGQGTPESPYSFDNEDPEGEVSLNLKYKPTSNISIEAAVNPDFSQIEPDAAQIDLGQTSALFYPERRPFFQEARELFATWRLAYYSRMINDPDVAVKGTGKIGATDFGYVLGRDQHSPFILPFRDASVYLTGKESISNVIRLRHTFGRDTYGGLLLTDRRFKGGGSGTVANLDGQIRLHDSWRLQTQAMFSWIAEPNDDDLSEQIERYVTSGWIDSTFDGGQHTAIFDGETFTGDYVMLNIEERSRHLNFDICYWHNSPSYRSDLGFLRTSNWRGSEFLGDYTFYFEQGQLERIMPYVTLARYWDFEGRQKSSRSTVGVETSLTGQLTLDMNCTYDAQRLRGVLFENMWNASAGGSKSFSEQVYVSVTGEYGRRLSRSDMALGKQTGLEFYAYLRPHDRVLIEPEYNYIKSIRDDDNSLMWEGYVFRTKMNYFFSRGFNVRLIVQYDDIYETLNIDPLITYRINPFTVFYLGTSYEFCDLICRENGWDEKGTYLNRRQFFAKIQYMIQM